MDVRLDVGSALATRTLIGDCPSPADRESKITANQKRMF
jgi:hypothetical protein